MARRTIWRWARASARPRRTSTRGGFAVLAQVAGEPAPERDDRVLGDAVRLGKDPGAAALLDDLGREDPLRAEPPGTGQVETLGAVAPALRDRVRRHLGRARRAQLAEGGEGVLVAPAARVVPVHQPRVGALGDQRQVRLVAVTVEVVEPQRRPAVRLREPRGEAGLPGPRGAGEHDHAGTRPTTGHGGRVCRTGDGGASRPVSSRPWEREDGGRAAGSRGRC